MSEGFEYKVFISYSHADRKDGAWLHRKLTGYKIPKRAISDNLNIDANRKIGRVFRDRDELATSHNLTAEVTKALNASEYMVVLCSPNAAASRWVNKEIIEFKKLRGEEYVHAIIIDGEPGASDGPRPELECFPPALRHKILADGSLSTAPAEVAAADIRPEADGRATAFLKILAGITGIELATLIDRDAKRTFWNVIKVTALSFMAMLAMGYATYEAIRAQREADFQRAEAEELIEFMLTDLKERLETVGRLDALEAVGDKAVGYYEAQDLTKMTDASVGRRSRAFNLLGSVQRSLGDEATALAMFERAAVATEAALMRDPNNPQRLFDHSQSVYWVGRANLSLGDIDKTTEMWSAYLRYAEKMVEIDPDNMKWQVELGFANTNMGELNFRRLGQPELARDYFRNAIELHSEVLKANPDREIQKYRVANNHAWLADAYRQLGNYSAAKSEREKQVAIFERHLAIEPDNKRMERTLARAKMAVAKYDFLLSSQFNSALFLESIEIAERLHQHDPDNKHWASILVACLLDYISTSLIAGRVEEVNIALDRVTILLGNLTNHEMDYYWLNRNLKLEALIVEAHHKSLSKNNAEAENLLDNVIYVLEQRKSAEKLSSSDNVNLARAYYYRAGASRSKGMTDFDKGLPIFRELDEWRPFMLLLYIDTLTQLGMNDQTIEIKKKLIAGGVSEKHFNEPT